MFHLYTLDEVHINKYEIEALTTEDIFNRLQIQNKGFMIYKFEYTLKEQMFMEFIKNIFYFIEMLFIGIFVLIIEIPLLFILGIIYIIYCLYESLKVLFKRCY